MQYGCFFVVAAFFIPLFLHNPLAINTVSSHLFHIWLSYDFFFVGQNHLSANEYKPIFLHYYLFGHCTTFSYVFYLRWISILISTTNEHDRQCECVSFWYSQDAFLCLVALWMLLIQSNRIFIRHCSELLYFYVDRYIQANEMEWTLIERLNQVSNLTAAAAAVASSYVLAAILHFQFNKWFFLLFFHLFQLKKKLFERIKNASFLQESSCLKPFSVWVNYLYTFSYF